MADLHAFILLKHASKEAKEIQVEVESKVEKGQSPPKVKGEDTTPIKHPFKEEALLCSQ